jgi:hypothetical protein
VYSIFLTPPHISSFGLAAQSYLWVEDYVLDNVLGIPGGNMSSGYGLPPSASSVAVMGKQAPPRRVFVRWFNFNQQRYYEAVLDDADLPWKIWRAEWTMRFKTRFHSHYDWTLTMALREDGVMEVWLMGFDEKLIGEPNTRFAEFLGSAHGREAPGDPAKYKNNTRRAREEGRVPLEPLPPPPATQPPLPKRDDAYGGTIPETQTF